MNDQENSMRYNRIKCSTAKRVYSYPRARGPAKFNVSPFSPYKKRVDSFCRTFRLNFLPVDEQIWLAFIHAEIERLLSTSTQHSKIYDDRSVRLVNIFSCALPVTFPVQRFYRVSRWNYAILNLPALRTPTATALIALKGCI